MGLVGILKGIGNRNIIHFLVLIIEVFVTGMLHRFETDNSKRCMSCCCIGMGLVTYYMGLVNILEGIGNGNVIWFCNYNRNHHSGSWSIGIWIRIGNIIVFCFSFLVFIWQYMQA